MRGKGYYIMRKGKYFTNTYRWANSPDNAMYADLDDMNKQYSKLTSVVRVNSKGESFGCPDGTVMVYRLGVHPRYTGCGGIDIIVTR